MNIEAYNLDSLRKLVRSLQNENKKLKEQLKKANIPYDSENIFAEKIENIEEYDPDQGGRGGYFPPCNHRWDNQVCPKQRDERLNCEACAHRSWTKLTLEKIISHLLGYKEDGSDVLGGIRSFQMVLANLSCLILTTSKKMRNRQTLQI